MYPFPVITPIHKGSDDEPAVFTFDKDLRWINIEAKITVRKNGGVYTISNGGDAYAGRLVYEDGVLKYYYHDAFIQTLELGRSAYIDFYTQIQVKYTSSKTFDDDVVPLGTFPTWYTVGEIVKEKIGAAHLDIRPPIIV